MAKTAIDLFAGAGGATQGLRDAGFTVVAAVENDPDAARTWTLNHPGVMIEADIKDVDENQLRQASGLSIGDLDLLKACPPCQGFSSLRGSKSPSEAQNDLVIETLRIVDGMAPRAVLLENVPGLRKDHRFTSLLDGMSERGYLFQDYIIEASELGVPQRRRRLVVVAVRGSIAPPATLEELVPPPLRRASLTAGRALQVLAHQMEPSDAWHVWRTSNDTVQRRIRAVPIGGTRFDLPEELQLLCHKRLSRDGGSPRNATASYGRVRLDDYAPTMTTRCTTPACGSFIHPTEDRGLSLREAAAFQTFPPRYRWHGAHGSVERQIGNAVPVWMAETLGRAVLGLLEPNEIITTSD